MKILTKAYILTWLVVWNHGILWLSIQLGISSSQLTFTPSFFRGVGRYTTNQCTISTSIFPAINLHLLGIFHGELLNNQMVVVSATSGAFNAEDALGTVASVARTVSLAVETAVVFVAPCRMNPPRGHGEPYRKIWNPMVFPTHDLDLWWIVHI